MKKDKTLKVKIPGGVETGRRIRLTGEGEAGVRGGPRGDLYVLLSVKPHKLFQRDGANLRCRVPITVTRAALGGEVDVPTIEGTRSSVKVPAGTVPVRTTVPVRVRWRSSVSTPTPSVRCTVPRITITPPG